jgi:hypothetical protein
MDESPRRGKNGHNRPTRPTATVVALIGHTPLLKLYFCASRLVVRFDIENCIS